MATTRDEGEDFGNPDLDDLDWGDPLEDTPDPSKDRKPVERFGKGFLKGVKETAKTPSVYTNALRTALPEGYSAAFQLADDTVQKTQGLYNEVAKDLAPAAREMKRVLRAAKKSADSFLPEKLSKKIDEWLKEEQKQTYRSNYDPTEAAITSELADVFKAQIQQTETSRAENIVRDGVEKKRFLSQFKQLDEIRRLMTRQVAYQDNVTMNYQRKSLEIQMRQMFIQRDLLEVTKASAMETAAHLKDITKNTGLPEAVKLRNSEIWEQLAKERLLGKVNDRFAPLAREVFNRVTANIHKRVKEVSGNIRDGVEQVMSVSDAMDEMEGVDKVGEAASMAGSAATNWVSQKIAKWAKPRIAKHAGVAAKGNELLYAAQNWDQLLKKKIEDQAPTTWFGEVLQDSILGALRWGGQQKIGHDAISEATSPTAWDNLARKSLVEIIPGFLARILQSSEGIRTRKAAPLMTYDHTRNEFTTVSGLSAQLHQRLVANDDLTRLSEDSNEIISLFDKGNELSPETRAKVKQFLLREVRKNNISDFDRFTDHSAYKGLGMSGSEIDQVVNLLQSGLEMDWDGKVGSSVSATELRQKFAYQMRNLRSNLPQYSDKANMFANTSNMEALREAGIVRKVMDEDHLDSDYVERRFRQFLEGEQADANASNQTYPGSSLDRHYDDLRSGSDTGSQISGGSRRRGSKANSTDLESALETLRQQLGTQHTKQIEVLEALAGQKGTSLETLASAVKDASSKEEVIETNKLLRELLEAFDELKEHGIPTSSRTASGARGQSTNSTSESDKSTLDTIRSSVQEGVDKVKGFVNDIDLSALKDAPKVAGNTAKEIWEQLDPVKVKMGAYRDSVTGAVVNKVSDIKQGVADLSEELSQKYQKAKSNFNDRNRIRALGRRYLGRGPFGLIEGAINLGRFGFKQAGRGIRDFGGLLMNAPGALMRGGQNLWNAGKWAIPKVKPFAKAAGSVAQYGAGQVAKGFGDLFRLGGLAGRGLKAVLPTAGGLAGKLAGGVGRGAFDLLRYGGQQVGKGFGDLKKILGFGGKLLTGGLPFLGRGKKIQASIDRIYDLLVRFFAFKGMPIDQLKSDGVDDATGKLKIRSRIKSVYDRMRERGSAMQDRLKGWKDSLSKYRRKGKDDEIEKPEEKKESGGWLGTLLGVITTLGGSITGALGGVGKLLTGKLTWLGEFLAAKMAMGSAADVVDDIDLPDGDGKKGKRVGKKRSWLRRMGTKAKVAGRALGRSRAVGFLGRAAAAIGLRGVAAAAGGALLTAAGGVAAGIGALLTAPVAIAVGVVGTAAYFTYKYFKEKLEPFQKFRMAQYGIPLDERDAILKVAETETELLEFVTWSGNTANNIREGFDVAKILERFGVNTRDPQSIKGMTQWFNYRFKPIYLRYLSAIRTLVPGVNLQELDTKVPKDKVESLLTALKIPDVTKNHPYAITATPFDGIEIVQGTTEIDDAAKEVLDTIKEWKRENRAKEISSKSQDVKAGATISDMIKADAEKRRAAEVKAAMVSSGSPEQRGVLREQVAMLQQKKASETGVAAGITQARIDQKQQYLGQSMAEYSKQNPASGAWIEKVRADEANFKKSFNSDVPKDGYYSKVPMPKGDGSWDAVKDTILTAAALIGVNPNTLANFARVESGFKTNARAGTSSAAGLFQFINSTWRGMMDSFGSQLGIPPNAKPTDPVAASLLAAQFIKSNGDYLRGTLGREPSVADSYMAHFLGPSGAKKFFEAPPDAIAARILPGAASANRTIFYGPSGARTVAEVYQLMSNKVNGKGAGSPKQLVDTAAVAKAVGAQAPLDASLTASKVNYDKVAKTTIQTVEAPMPAAKTVAQNLRQNAVMVTPKDLAEVRTRQVQEQHKLAAESQVQQLDAAVSILQESLKIQTSMNQGITNIHGLLKGLAERPVPKVAEAPVQQVANAAKPRPVLEQPQVPVLLRREV